MICFKFLIQNRSDNYALQDLFYPLENMEIWRTTSHINDLFLTLHISVNHLKSL